MTRAEEPSRQCDPPPLLEAAHQFDPRRDASSGWARELTVILARPAARWGRSRKRSSGTGATRTAPRSLRGFGLPQPGREAAKGHIVVVWVGCRKTAALAGWVA
jgi:hypothetical protein